MTQNSIFENQIFNFAHSETAGTSENMKIHCTNYVYTKFGAFITICTILPLTAALLMEKVAKCLPTNMQRVKKGHFYI